MRASSVFLTVACLASPAFASPNYEAVLNGSVHEIRLGEEYSFPLAEGAEPVRLLIRLKEQQTYSDEFVEFAYNKKFSLTETGLHEGVNQILLNSALGTIIIVQEYSTVNPAALTSFFLNELTADERAAGFTLSTKPYARETGGRTLQGIEAAVERDEKKIRYVVAAYGAERSGLLIAVRTDSEFEAADKQLVQTFWETLKINLSGQNAAKQSDAAPAAESPAPAAP